MDYFPAYTLQKIIRTNLNNLRLLRLACIEDQEDSFQPFAEGLPLRIG